MSRSFLNTKIITLHPKLFPGPLSASVTGRALKKKIWSLETIDLREFGEGKHKKVDDKPFSGGPGLIIKPDVLDKALKKANEGPSESSRVTICMSPRGVSLDQNLAVSLSKLKNLTIICGRFEGVDQRVIEFHNIVEVSIGDFILSGGELGALVLLDTIVRLLPGTLGNPLSTVKESFADNLLKEPQFTKPLNWNGLKVPEILLKGDHRKISEWKVSASEEVTKRNRPDLFIKYIEKKKKMIKRK